MKKQKQMKALRVSEYVKELANQVTKKVAVDTKGEVTTINGTLQYVLEAYLEKGE